MLQTLTGNIFTHKTIVDYTQLQSATANLNIQGLANPNTSLFTMTGFAQNMYGGLSLYAQQLSGDLDLNVQYTSFSTAWPARLAYELTIGINPTYTVVVVGGTGIGQVNHVHTFFSDTNTFVFDNVWTVPIDATSVLLFCRPDLSYEGTVTKFDSTSFIFNSDGGHNSALSIVDNYYVGFSVAIQNQEMAGFKTSLVTAYNGTTKLFTISPGALNDTPTTIFISRLDLCFEGLAVFRNDINSTRWGLNTGTVTTNSTSSLDRFYNGCVATVTSGLGLGATSMVVGSSATDHSFTIQDSWNVDNTSVISLQRKYVYTYQGRVTGATNSSRTFTASAFGFYPQSVFGGTLPSHLVTTQDFYTGCVVFVEEGMGKGTANIVTGYNGGTFTVQNAWTIDTTSVVSFLRPQMDASGTINAVGASGSFRFVSSLSGVSSVDDFYTGTSVKVVSGAGSGSTNLITGYVGSTKTFTTQTPWNIDSTSTISVFRYNSFKDITLFGLPANHMIVGVKIVTLVNFAAGSLTGNQNAVWIYVGNSSNMLVPVVGGDSLISDVHKTYGMASVTIPSGSGDSYQYGSFRWFTVSAPGQTTYSKNPLPGNPTSGSYCIPQRLDAHDVIARFCILDFESTPAHPELETQWNFNSHVTTGVVEITVQYLAI